MVIERFRTRPYPHASPAGLTRGSIILRKNAFAKKMDCRVKPGNDSRGESSPQAAMRHCRLAPLFLSNTANIGPSDTMLPWRLSEGAYKLAALPPSRNRALGQ